MKGSRPKNSDVRPREHLTPAEVDKVLEASKKGDHGHRNYAMILLAYRHGFRASELCGMAWSHVDFTGKVLHVGRSKNGVSTTQPLADVELKALRKLEKETRQDGIPWVFQSGRGRITRNTFWRVVRDAGRAAGMQFPIHPHMLRHACGYRLANAGTDTRLIQDFLGHRNIQHTVRYTATNPERFAAAAKLFEGK